MAPPENQGATSNDTQVLSEAAVSNDALLSGAVATAEVALDGEVLAVGGWQSPSPEALAQGGCGFFDKGAASRGRIWWVISSQTGGGRGNQGIGDYRQDTPPEIETGIANGLPWARVKSGTGTIIVERSYTAVQAGDQGTGEQGSLFAGKRVYVTDLLARHLDAHEQGHVTATGKIFSQTLKLAIDAAEKYQKTRLTGNAGESEAQVKDRLQKQINWEKYRSEFVDKDRAVNDGNGKFHAWETGQGGGPLSNHQAGDTIGGVRYDVVLRSRAEVEASYRLPNYSSYNPNTP